MAFILVIKMVAVVSVRFFFMAFGIAPVANWFLQTWWSMFSLLDRGFCIPCYLLRLSGASLLGGKCISFVYIACIVSLLCISFDAVGKSHCLLPRSGLPLMAPLPVEAWCPLWSDVPSQIRGKRSPSFSGITRIFGTARLSALLPQGMC